jgi:hypothetical protein
MVVGFFYFHGTILKYPDFFFDKWCFEVYIPTPLERFDLKFLGVGFAESPEFQGKSGMIWFFTVDELC